MRFCRDTSVNMKSKVVKVKYHQSNQSVTRIQAWIRMVFRNNDYVQVKSWKSRADGKNTNWITHKNYIKSLKSKYFGLNKKSWMAFQANFEAILRSRYHALLVAVAMSKV